MSYLFVLSGREFVFDGERWYNQKTFQSPTPAETISLFMMLEKQLGDEQASSSASASKRVSSKKSASRGDKSASSGKATPRPRSKRAAPATSVENSASA